MVCVWEGGDFTQGWVQKLRLRTVVKGKRGGRGLISVAMLGLRWG